MIHKLATRFAITAVALLMGLAAFGHNGMEHVMGTVTAMSDKSVTVETLQHKSTTVLLDSSTTFTHDDSPASAADLKVGDRVVIHAKVNGNKQLVGSIVKWGATKSVQSKHSH